MKRILIICTLLFGIFALSAMAKPYPKVLCEFPAMGSVYKILSNGTINNGIASGWWKESNGAYIVSDNYAEGAAFLGVVYGNTFYNMYISNDYETIFDYNSNDSYFDDYDKSFNFRLRDGTIKRVLLFDVPPIDKSDARWF